ncbi:MAG: triose-phosphate isomerase [Muribaculaceae bacterium]|nr:triose-phosphate isomerase [Muribaculaceae bacterium]
MRKNIVAGNWKMNTTVPDGIQLANEVKQAVAAAGQLKCDVIVGVPFTHLVPVAQALEGSAVAVAAENCADHDKGAYTGEVSAAMVASTGAQYVILGHSERRGYYAETIEMLKTKIDLALAAGLRVIFCCGESLDERKAGTHFDIIKNEIVGSLFHLDAEAFGKVVIAYEPIWAIGTGETATAEQAEEIHAFIRKQVAEKYGDTVADNTTILYGGSCKPSNAPELFAKPDIDGGLIGGASLKAADFMGIVTAF